MTSITVTNGAGETIYEGAPGQITADPPLEQFDGTINITQHWSDGSTRDFTVEHEAGKPVKIGWNSATGEYEVESGASALGTAAGFFGGIAGAVASHEVSRASVGTVDVDGEEKGIAKNDDRVTSGGVGGKIGYNFGKFGGLSGLRLSLDFQYNEGDTDATATEPIGGNTVANTYSVNNPDNGSTGVGLGATGAEAMSKLEFVQYSFRGLLEADVPVSDTVVLTGGVSSFYRGSWQMATGSFQSLTFDGISSTSDQELDDHLYGAGLNTRLSFAVNEQVTLFGGGGIDLIYRDASLWSGQHNLCDLCPAAELDFISEVEQNDSGLTYGLNLKTGARVVLGAWRFELEGGFDYLDERSDLKNRENPSQPETHFDEKSAVDWQFRLAVGYSF